MAVNGHSFNNHNASIECSIQSHKFKDMFTTCRYFFGKFTDQIEVNELLAQNAISNRLLVKDLKTFEFE